MYWAVTVRVYSIKVIVKETFSGISHRAIGAVDSKHWISWVIDCPEPWIMSSYTSICQRLPPLWDVAPERPAHNGLSPEINGWRMLAYRQEWGWTLIFESCTIWTQLGLVHWYKMAKVWALEVVRRGVRMTHDHGRILHWENCGHMMSCRQT